MIFSVTCTGYPMPMAFLCAGHLGEFLERDASQFGSTQAWLLRVSKSSDCSACLAEDES